MSRLGDPQAGLVQEIRSMESSIMRVKLVFSQERGTGSSENGQECCGGSQWRRAWGRWGMHTIADFHGG